MFFQEASDRLLFRAKKRKPCSGSKANYPEFWMELGHQMRIRINYQYALISRDYFSVIFPYHAHLFTHPLSFNSFTKEATLMLTDTTQRRNLCTLTLIPLLAVLMSLTAGCSDQESSTPQQTQSTETPAVQEAEQETTPPAAAPEPAPTPEPAAATGGTEASSAEGESIYQKTCKSCHDAGVAGAPKLGDSAAWAPRIEKGNDALLESVKNGLNVMPPMGTCMSCSDEELRSAIAYMISQGS